MKDALLSSECIWEHAKTLAGLLLDSVRTRVELFALELQEERRRLVQTILLAVLVAALAVFALVLFTFAVLLVCWENARIPAVLGLTATYMCSAIFAGRALWGKIGQDKAFSGTISELKKDCACLKERP
jgi:uncharacterized membrane protein YqjE